MGKSIKNLSSVTIVGLDIAKNVFQVHGDRREGRGDRRALGATRGAAELLFLAAAMPGGDGGVLVGASLGAGADRARPSR